MRHINVPVFIPHLGCPNQCVFCNQRSISGVRRFEADEVVPIIEEALSTAGADDEVEIAFFGGSFTGIDRELMIKLLSIAYGYIEKGAVSSLRCSTRPDYINKEILEILKRYGVKTVELGLQSSSEEVLRLTKRGHDRDCEINACRMIKEAGLSLVGQMMIGLPGSDLESELRTAELIISSDADAARIYPTVVFRETELCEKTRSGVYTPLTLDEAVERSAAVYERLFSAGVNIIRVGLCATENLRSEETYFAGPNHPALGELVLGEVYYRKILEKTKGLLLNESTVLTVSVGCGRLSAAIGQKKKNKLRLIKALGIKEARFLENRELSELEVSLMTE